MPENTGSIAQSDSASNRAIPTVDEIQERVAIVADGEGLSQRRAERTVAWSYGCDTFGELLRRAKK